MQVSSYRPHGRQRSSEPERATTSREAGPLGRLALRHLPLLLSFLVLIGLIADVSAQSSVLPTFVDSTDAAGLAYDDETWGWAWGDYNQDGWLDIFLGHHPNLTVPVPHDRDSALMLSVSGTRFTNVIADSGIPLQSDRHDQIWVDYDNDGDLDLWITIGAVGGTSEVPKQLFRNDGGGRFADVAAESGVDYPMCRGRGSAWLDYDRDGDLDLYLTCAERTDAPNALFSNDGDGTFTNVTAQSGVGPYLGNNSNVAVADYDDDGDQDMMVTGTSATLYRNDGAVFTHVGGSAGVSAYTSASACWGDYDNDGDLDLYVTRSSMEFLDDYVEVLPARMRFSAVGQHGDEDGIDFTVPIGAEVTFTLQEQYGGVVVRKAAVIFLGPDGANPAGATFTIGTGEVSTMPPYSVGTDTGFFIWQPVAGSFRIRWTGADPQGTMRYRFSGVIETTKEFTHAAPVDFELPSEPSTPNRLYRNEGGGQFVEVGATAGVGYPWGSCSCDWGDFDNDGYLDLFVATLGSLYGNTPDVIYHNLQNGTFLDVASAVSATGATEGYGWGGLWVDYNRDGFLDIFTSQESLSWPLDPGGYHLLTNQRNGNHWIELDLRTTDGNTRAYGAKVWVTAGGLTHYREVADNSHYFHHYTGPLHVGLGANAVISELRVVWPSGREQVTASVAADRLLVVQEDMSLPVPTPTPTPTAPLMVDMIVDNLESGFASVGSWVHVSDVRVLHYGPDFVYSAKGTGGNTGEFRVTVPRSGAYEVFVWWPECWLCAKDARLVIGHSGGSTDVSVNMNDRALAGQWVSLGVYDFDAGGVASVSLSSQASGRVMADAIRVVSEEVRPSLVYLPMARTSSN